VEGTLASLALTLAPYDARALAVFETLLAQTQRAAARPLALIISCEKHFGRALRVSDRLTQLAGIDHRIVVGQTAQVPEHPRLMRVAAADDYESLSHKVAGSSDYAGFVIGVPSHDRTWHWQKCRTEALNQQVYGKRYVGTWAQGFFYYLSSHALRAFTIAQIRFPAEIAGELYEDKFVGDTLRREGITATALDPATVGIAADNIEPIDAASPTTSPSRLPAPNTEIASIARPILDASDSGHTTEAHALLQNALAAHPRAPELVALTRSIPTMYGHDFYDGRPPNVSTPHAARGSSMISAVPATWCSSAPRFRASRAMATSTVVRMPPGSTCFDSRATSASICFALGSGTIRPSSRGMRRTASCSSIQRSARDSAMPPWPRCSTCTIP
jgi:hypothetical protein